MLKRSAIILCVLIGMVMLPSTTAAFTDVTTHTAHYEGIVYTQSRNIVQGYADGSFRPGATINRAEFTKILVGSRYTAEEIAECNTNSVRFSDVKAQDWFAPFVCVASRDGIVTGYPGGTFRPAATIIFPESAAMLVRAFEIATDTDTTVWYRPFGKAMSDRNAIPETILRLDQTITRGEMAEMVFRLDTRNTGRSFTSYGFLEAVPAWTGEMQEHEATAVHTIRSNARSFTDHMQGCSHPFPPCTQGTYFHHVTFAPSGPGFHYIVVSLQKVADDTQYLWEMMRDGNPAGSYGKKNALPWEIGHVAYSKDGRHSAYYAQEDDTFFVVHDDQAGKRYARAPSETESSAPSSPPFFLADNTLVYAVPPSQTQGPIVVVAGKEIAFEAGTEVWGLQDRGVPAAMFILERPLTAEEATDALCKKYPQATDACQAIRSGCAASKDCLRDLPEKTRQEASQLLSSASIQRGEQVIVAGPDGSIRQRGRVFLEGTIQFADVRGADIFYTLAKQDPSTGVDIGTQFAWESKNGVLQYGESFAGHASLYTHPETLTSVVYFQDPTTNEVSIRENGTEIGRHRFAHAPVFDNDGLNFLYVASDKQRTGICDPEEVFLQVGTKRSASFAGIQHAMFAPDDVTPVFAVQICYGGASVVIGDAKGPVFDEVYAPFRFTDDGRRVSYGARKGNTLYRVDAPLP